MFKISGLNLPNEVTKEAENTKSAKNGKAKKTNAKLGQEKSLEQMVQTLDNDGSDKNKQKKPRNRKRKQPAEVQNPDNDTETTSDIKKVPTKNPETEEVDTPDKKRKLDKPLIVSSKKLTPMQQKMQQKLSGSRFRWINELLYTSESEKALAVFQSQPEVFDEYHEGFKHQVESWPENPVDSIVQQFQDRLQRNLNAPGGLPATKHLNQVVVADMGCGEAELALKLNQIKHRKARFEVHSFDLHKANDRITVADIAHVPLPDNSCHVVVFCLALMGTNLNDFIMEGIRILKDNGIMWIAEIKSRFEDGKYDDFIAKLKSVGLYHKVTDDSNKMFVKFEFLKLSHRMAKAKSEETGITLKPCIYKRR